MEEVLHVKNDLSGQKFGRWTVLYPTNKRSGGKRLYHCRCDCGTERDVSEGNLKRGVSKSCGCYKKEVNTNNKKCKKYNKYNIESEEYGIGWTINDEYEFYFDKEDYDLIYNYCWHKHQDGYLRTFYDSYYDDEGKRHNKYIMMHQLLSEKYFGGELLDHINGLPYDNRKENLRVVAQKDNMKNLKLYSNNTSGHKGVIQTPNGNWMAYIQCDNNRYNLGTFSTYEEAVVSREIAEHNYFNEYNRSREYL